MMARTAPTPSAARLLFVAVAATLSTSGVVVVDAWSGGAGTCEVGSDGPAFPQAAPHVGGKQGELGSGENGLYRVVLGTAILDENAADLNVTAGTDLPLYVRRNDETAKIKGFLFTLQSLDSGDASGAFKMEQSTDPVRILESDDGDGALATPTTPAVCPAKVSGATHIDPALKDNAKLTINVGAGSANEGGSVQLTVTVMESTSSWYFSTFNLTVLAGPPAPGKTAAPTAAPSGATGNTALSALVAAAASSALALTWFIA